MLDSSHLTRYVRIFSIGCVLVLGVALALGLSASADDAWRAELERRLTALQPERTADYLALAEDVMDRGRVQAVPAGDVTGRDPAPISGDDLGVPVGTVPLGQPRPGTGTAQ